MAITGSDELGAIFVAGLTYAESLYQYPFPGPLSVISRIDLERSTHVFRQVYSGDSDKLQTITALALSPDMMKLAVHAIQWNEGNLDESSYMFVISALDGSYITRLIKITHGEPNVGEALVQSTGLLYD